MSLRVRPAGESDIAPVAALLHEKMNAKIPEARWRSLLDYPWRPVDAERGWLVEDAGHVVGFMGTIYADRIMSGRRVRTCDLSSWYLMKAYRGEGVGDALLEAGMAKPDVTYRTMTARRATGRKIRALGFSVLDDTRSLFRREDASTPKIDVEWEEAAILARLSAPDRQILKDHAGLAVHHAFCSSPRGQGTWLVWQRKYKADHVAYHDILYANDPDFLSANAGAIASAMIEEGVLAIDSRFMRAADPAGEVETIPLARWFRSPDLSPQEIDHLYSEILLLDQKLP